MFVGHYGPAAALVSRDIKLWHGFIAVQLLDILWAPFVLLGIEHVRIVENFTESNHFDLYHMPYTHSLVMALVWSVVAGGLYGLLRKRGALIIGALVFSHWLLDFITHKPDLELWFGGPKVGLALWDNRLLALGLEFTLLIGGFLLFLSRTHAKSAVGKASPFIVFTLFAAAQLYGNFGPPPESAAMAAQSAIIAYLVFAALAAWLDAARSWEN